MTDARTAIYCFSSHPQIIQCRLHSNSIGIEARESAPTISCCTIVNNETGVYFTSGHHNSVEIKDNVISQNDIGIVAAGTRLQLGLTNNDLSGNGMAIMLGGPRDVDARNNWWGSPDVGLVGPIVHDQDDDPQLGTVYFRPFLAGPPVFPCDLITAK